MSKKNRNRKIGEEIVAFVDQLLGDASEMSKEEVNALYADIAPDKEPAELLRRVASRAAQQYRLQGKKVPNHVVAALEKKTEDVHCSETKPSGLMRIIEKALQPKLEPTESVSYAFRKKQRLSDKDRKILEELSEEVQEDWEQDE